MRRATPWQKRTQEVYIHDEIQIMKIKILPSVLFYLSEAHTRRKERFRREPPGRGVGGGCLASLLVGQFASPEYTDARTHTERRRKICTRKKLNEFSFLYAYRCARAKRLRCFDRAAESVFERHSGGNNAFGKEIRARYTRKAS